MFSREVKSRSIRINPEQFEFDRRHGTHNQTNGQQSRQANRQETEQNQDLHLDHTNDGHQEQHGQQAVNITINNDGVIPTATSHTSVWSGRITGRIWAEAHNGLALLSIELHFGPESAYPVTSFEILSGRLWDISDLPPGFYTLVIRSAGMVRVRVPNLRISPGQTVEQNIALPSW